MPLPRAMQGLASCKAYIVCIAVGKFVYKSHKEVRRDGPPMSPELMSLLTAGSQHEKM